MKNLEINPSTGTIDRKMPNGSKRCNIGTRTHGYMMVWDGQKVRGAHRIIWESVNGPIAKGFEVDHINGVRDDNRIVNLRLVNRTQNNQNTRNARIDNTTSGVKGVSLHKQSGRWRARIKISNTSTHLGMFDSIEEASQAYAKAAALIHTHNPHARKEKP
jgi:hypothetical protein